MYVELIKDHFSGLKKGVLIECDEKLGNRLIDQGYSKESTKKDYDKYLLDFKKSKAKAIEKRQLELDKKKKSNPKKNKLEPKKCDNC